MVLAGEAGTESSLTQLLDAMDASAFFQDAEVSTAHVDSARRATTFELEALLE